MFNLLLPGTGLVGFLLMDLRGCCRLIYKMSRLQRVKAQWPAYKPLQKLDLYICYVSFDYWTKDL